LFDTFLGYHIRSKEYGDQRAQVIDKYAISIATAFKTYNSKDWGYFAGDTTVRALHGYGYYVAGRWVAGILEGVGGVTVPAPVKMTCDNASLPVGAQGVRFTAVSKNAAKVINGVKFTGHALDRMQERGILSPSVVIDAIQNPSQVLPGDMPNTMIYIRENLKVVVNESGDIITAMIQSAKK